MKKLITAAAIAVMAAFGATADTVTDVYNFKATIKQPLLKAGVRDYASVALKGYLYFEYDESTNSVGAVYAVVENSKTKVVHTIDFTDGFYNLMGKTTKTSFRSVPTVWFDGADSNVEEGTGKGAQEPHETIVKVTLAGKGMLKYLKDVILGCTSCGGGSKLTTYCSKLNTMSGNIVGYMDCECPDPEPWNHTVETCACGVREEDGDIVRSHYASFFGTWSASWNKKLSH